MITHHRPAIQFRRSRRYGLRGLALLLGLLVLGGCKAQQRQAPTVARDNGLASTAQEETRMWMTIGEHRFAITLADSKAAQAFAARLPLTLDMADLNGNEKHAELAQPLPANASRPGRIHAGDLLLYGSETVVLFYQTFRSIHSYTRLGGVDDPASLAKVVGSRSVRVVFSAE